MHNYLKGNDVLVIYLKNLFNGIINLSCIVAIAAPSKHNVFWKDLYYLHYASLYLIIMERQNSRKLEYFIQTICNYEGEENDD